MEYFSLFLLIIVFKRHYSVILTTNAEENRTWMSLLRGFHVYNNYNNSNMVLTVLFFVRLPECPFFLTSHVLYDNNIFHSKYMQPLNNKQKKETFTTNLRFCSVWCNFSQKENSFAIELLLLKWHYVADLYNHNTFANVNTFKFRLLYNNMA